jgi:hypothetical protein
MDDMRTGLFLSLLFLVGATVAKAKPFTYSVTSWDRYIVDGEEFLAIRIEPTEPIRVNTTAALQAEWIAHENYQARLASYFAELANIAVHDTFIKAYPEIPEKFFRDLHRKNEMLDGKSSVILIGKGDGKGNLVETLSTVRIARRLERSDSLPGQKKFGVKIPETKRTPEDIEAHRKWLNERNIMTGPPATFPDWDFQTMEFANLAAAKEYRDISMSLLARELRQILATSGYGFFANNLELRAHDRIVLFCQEKLVPYYEQFGLRVEKRHSADVIQLGGWVREFDQFWFEKNAKRASIPYRPYADKGEALAPIRSLRSSGGSTNLAAGIARLVSGCKILQNVRTLKQWGVKAFPELTANP